MRLQRYFFLIISFLLITISCSFAQGKSGQIQGVITDSTTGDVLFGANIILKGTSLGAATDINGHYKILDVPSGNYTLVIRYIGYKSKEASITINGTSLEFNASLLSEAVQGETVVVTAQALGQKGAINQQLTSNTIINVVSAEKMRELPDDNAASALARLPGVSLMNGDQVVIRGVEAKLNQVLINGIQMPSTGMTDRATGLGFISSNMLAGIQVIKALTPDMDANAVGGVVNLKLREAPSGFHLDVLTQGNYNSQDRVTDNYKFWLSLSDRFLDDKLGVFLQGNADRSDVGNQIASVGYNILGVGNTSYGEAVYQMENATMEDQNDWYTNHGLSLILDYLLPNGKIVLQNMYAHNLTDARNYRNFLNFSGDAINYNMYRDKFGRDLYLSALQAENYFGNIKVEASLSHSYTNKYTRARYGDSGANYGFANESTLQEPWGEDASGNKILYASKLQTLDIYKSFEIFDNINPVNADSAQISGWVTAKSEAFSQHLYNTAFDVSMPLTFSKEITSTFKAGGKYIRTTRTNDVESYFSGTSESDTYTTVAHFFPYKTLSQGNKLKLTDVMQYNYKRGKYFLEDEYDFKNGFVYAINADIQDNWFEEAMKGWQPKQKWNESWRDDFNGSEQFTAGYVMGTFDIFSKLTLITGLRYENYNMKYKANFVYEVHNVYGDAILVDNAKWDRVDRTDKNFFPNLQLKYKVNDWSDVRAAYTTGIARPDYLAILPKVFEAFNGDITVGNPKCKPTYSNNLDLNVSFYNNEIGLFTLGGFYKKLNDVFYYTGIYYSNIAYYNVAIPDSATLANYKFKVPTKSNIIYCYLNNTNPGYIRGFEIDWQTNFWYLPGPLSSVVLSANYTKSWSEMDYRQMRNVTSKVKDPVTGKLINKYTTIDTIFTARLPHQAEDVVNIALGMDYKGLSARISFNMQGNVINGVGTRPETNEYTGNIYRWDFTIKQNLPVEGLSIALNGVNIFHNPIYTYRKFRKAVDLPITENLIRIEYLPTIFQVNLRYGL
jgi:TonB-dependent receptor